MDAVELSSYLLKDLGTADDLQSTVRWLERDDRRLRFTDENRTKIRAKLTRRWKDREDLQDFIVELDVAAHCLRHPDVRLIYEPSLGKSTVGDRLAAPDFSVTFGDAFFYLEVARIRKTAAEVDIDSRGNSLDELTQKALSEIPSGCHVLIIDIGSLFAFAPESMSRTIADLVATTIATRRQELDAGEDVEEFVPLTAGRASVRIFRRPDVPSSAPTTMTPGARPIPYSNAGREALKFSDIVLGKMRQVVPGKPNVLVIRAASNVHDKEDLERGLYEITKAFQRRDEELFARRGLTLQTFLERSKFLSGVVAWTSVGNRYWSNPSSSMPIPEAASEHLDSISL